MEYWTIHAILAAGEPPLFEAKLTKYKGEEIEVHTQAEATRLWPRREGAMEGGERHAEGKAPLSRRPPFTTSKLQQAAYNRLRYTAKRTMGLAQRLYEGVELGQEGSVALITYMRTDSVRVSNDALDQVRDLIGSRYGQRTCPKSRISTSPRRMRRKRTKRFARQMLARTPEDVRPFLSDDMFRLYQLIWQRFVASQMVPGGVRPDDRRHVRGRLHVSRDRLGAEI